MVVAVTVGVAAWLGRRSQLELSPLPWGRRRRLSTADQSPDRPGAVVITAIVLLVTLSSRSAIQSSAFTAVVVMFLVAFLWFVGVAVEFTYVPLEGGPEGPLIPRLLFVIGGIQPQQAAAVADAGDGCIAAEGSASSRSGRGSMCWPTSRSASSP